MKKAEALYKFKRAMDRLNFPAKTRKSYLSMFGRFCDYYKPGQTIRENIDNFIIKLRFRRHATSTINLYVCAIRKFFKLVPNKDIGLVEIPYMQKERKLPTVYSQDEMARMFAVNMNPKHRLLLALAYGCGLRVSEVVSIRNRDIYLDRGLMRVYGKGRKERLVPIRDIPQELLKTYMCNGDYLFPGQFGGHLSTRSAEKIFDAACRLAGIKRRSGIHGLRHSYCSNSLEQGTDLRVIQKVAGHASIKTTTAYVHVADEFLSQTRSPIAGII
jgi:site-specific recombinase XerD